MNRLLNRFLTLRGSMLLQDAASAALRNIQLGSNTINASTTKREAQKFLFAASV